MAAFLLFDFDSLRRLLTIISEIPIRDTSLMRSSVSQTNKGQNKRHMFRKPPQNLTSTIFLKFDKQKTERANKYSDKVYKLIVKDQQLFYCYFFNYPLSTKETVVR